MNNNSVGIFIPTYNEEENLKVLLPLIKKQTIHVEQIVIFDSGSTDKTVNIAEEYGCIIGCISNNDFNHGVTRNEAVKLLNTDFILVTVADSKPVNELWIEKLLSGFSSKNVVAVVGPQGSPANSSYYPREWLVSRMKSRHQAFSLLAPEFGPATDDCNTLYRRSALLELKFPRTSFGEDVMWSKLVKEKGYEISMIPEAGVYHYHKKSYYHFKERSIHVQMSLDKYFNLDYGSTFNKGFHAFYLFILDYFKVLPFVGIKTWLKWFPFNLLMAKARMAGFREYYKNGLGNAGLLRREELQKR